MGNQQALDAYGLSAESATDSLAARLLEINNFKLRVEAKTKRHYIVYGKHKYYVTVHRCKSGMYRAYVYV
jgi:hypothetical protein